MCVYEDKLIFCKIRKRGRKVFEMSKEGESGVVLLSISDSDIGIKKRQAPHSFEKFYKAGDTLSRRHVGSGPGLSIKHKKLRGYVALWKKRVKMKGKVVAFDRGDVAGFRNKESGIRGIGFEFVREIK